MKKRILQGKRRDNLCLSFMPTVILAVCFLTSELLGCILVALSGDSVGASLASYLRNYVSLLTEGSAVFPSVWNVIWEVCAWPLFVSFFGFTALGVLVIPAAFCVRGFLLSYAISSFVQVFGSAGFLGALAVFGVTAFFSVPVLFSLGTAAFSVSLDLAGGASGDRSPGRRLRRYARCLPPCGTLVFLAVLLEYAAVPALLRNVSEMLASV